MILIWGLILTKISVDRHPVVLLLHRHHAVWCLLGACFVCTCLRGVILHLPCLN